MTEALQDTTITLYGDGSKDDKGHKACVWVSQIGVEQTTNVKGQCRIGYHAYIEEGEIHTIQEGLRSLVQMGITGIKISFCVENQNPLRVLSVGPSANREDVKRRMEDVKL